MKFFLCFLYDMFQKFVFYYVPILLFVSVVYAVLKTFYTVIIKQDYRRKK